MRNVCRVCKWTILPPGVERCYFCDPKATKKPTGLVLRRLGR